MAIYTQALDREASVHMVRRKGLRSNVLAV